MAAKLVLCLGLFAVLLVGGGAAQEQAETLKVFLVPHSHCDAGYRETVNGYWRDKVSRIIPNVISYLEKNKALKFVWDETIWLSYFMQTASQDMRTRLLQLVSSKRLEIIGGGWVMHDEADSSLRSVLNQLTVGFDYLQAHVGTRPRFQWHIDPFGHSALSPIVFAGLGYSAFVINRVPNDVKMSRRAGKSLEFMWEALDKPLANDDSRIFAHLLDSHYSPPTLAGTSIPQKADSFASVVKTRASYFNTSNLLLPWGNDFGFLSSTDFEDLIMLISAVRVRHPELDVRIATLSDYFEALRTDPRAQFHTAQGTDFFPYIACSGSSQTCFDLPSGAADAYWSGFYTSRPSEKYLSYQQDASLQAADTLLSLAMLANLPSVTSLKTLPSELVAARQASGLLQHHDAITGTSFNYCTISITECNVVSDYISRLQVALNATETLAGVLKGKLLSTSPSTAPSLRPEADILSGLAQLTGSNALALVVGNPLAVPREEIYSVTICNTATCSLDLSVTDDKGNAVQSQIVVDHVRDTVLLYFPVSVTPLGLNTYFLTLKKTSLLAERVPTLSDDDDRSSLSLPVLDVTSSPLNEESNNNNNNNNNSNSNNNNNNNNNKNNDNHIDRPREVLPPKFMSETFEINNGKISVTFQSTGRVADITDLVNNVSLPFNVDLIHMKERLPPVVGNIFVGGNVYTFVPDGSAPVSLFDDAAEPILTANGPLVWQVDVPLRSSLCDKTATCAHTVRLLASTKSPLADNTLYLQPRVGPLLQSTNESGSVLLTAGPTSGALSSTDTFTTDMNGHLRFTRRYNHTRPLQGNMYPIVGGLGFSSTLATPRDARSAAAAAAEVGLAALPAGPLAGTVLDETLHLMVHRRINDSDRRGDDTTVVDQPIAVLFGAPSTLASQQAQVAAAIASPLTLHWAVTASPAAWLADAHATYTPLATPFPSSVNLVGLRTRFPGNLSHVTATPHRFSHPKNRRDTQSSETPANANNIEVGVWVQAQAGTAGGNVDLSLLGRSGWSQTSLDFQQPIDTARRSRLTWRYSSLAEDDVTAVPEAAADTADVPANAVVAFKVAIN